MENEDKGESIVLAREDEREKAMVPGNQAVCVRTRVYACVWMCMCM